MTEISERLADPATADGEIADWARGAEPGAALDRLVGEGAARLVRHPAIVAALFANPKAPMGVVNRAVAICARAGVRVDEIPSFDEVAAALAADPAQPTGTAESAGSFEAALEQARALPDEDDGAAPVADEKKRRSPIIDFGKLKLFEKIRLATLGNAYCRQNLVRDSNRLVAMAAIRSPGITEMEIVRAAGNRALSEDVIRFIANKKDYVKIYPVKMNLVANPKCPLALSLRLLAHLRPEDLKNIARSKNVPNALATAAKKLAATRGTQ
jgi:hypothetical protein